MRRIFPNFTGKYPQRGQPIEELMADSWNKKEREKKKQQAKKEKEERKK